MKRPRETMITTSEKRTSIHNVYKRESDSKVTLEKREELGFSITK